MAAVSIGISMLVSAGALFLVHEGNEGQAGRRLRYIVHYGKLYARHIGIVPKIKLALTFTQVIAALESTYDIGLPDSWFRWTAFLRFFGDLDWMNWVVPSECVIGKGMAQVLLLRALVPLAIIIAVPVVGAAVFVIKQRVHSTDAPQAPQKQGSELTLNQGSETSKALVHWLPFSLVIAFCITPSLSASIFRAWQCLTFSYDDKAVPIEEHAFLAQDLDVRCDDSADYNHIQAVAWVLVGIWPIGWSQSSNSRVQHDVTQMLTRRRAPY